MEKEKKGKKKLQKIGKEKTGKNNIVNKKNRKKKIENILNKLFIFIFFINVYIKNQK